ncbi:MAG: AI-2E family transporter, partial [Planctomycetota bacterium]
EATWLVTGSLVILATVAVALVLHYTRAIMIPFVLAIFIVQLVNPILDFQVIRLRLPRVIAWVVTFLVVIVIMVLFGLLVVQSVQTIISRAGTYSEEFVKLAEETFAVMDRWGIDLTQDKIVSDLRNRIPGLVTNTLGTVFGLTSSFFFVLIFAAFLLAGRNPHGVRSGVYADIDHNVRRYIAIKVVVSTLTGLLVWVSLSLIGLELAGVFGVLAFLLNFIPSIGSIVSTLLPIPIAVAQFQEPWPVILVVAIPGVLQITIGPGNGSSCTVVLGIAVGDSGDVPSGADDGGAQNHPDAV